jgi:hypothetical protein
LEVVPPLIVLVEELTSSSLSESLLSEAISEALGISLSKVLNLYFGELDEVRRDHLIWESIDRHRGEEEDMLWLEERSRRVDEAEFRSYYEDDTF